MHRSDVASTLAVMQINPFIFSNTSNMGSDLFMPACRGGLQQCTNVAIVLQNLALAGGPVMVFWRFGREPPRAGEYSGSRWPNANILGQHAGHELKSGNNISIAIHPVDAWLQKNHRSIKGIQRRVPALAISERRCVWAPTKVAKASQVLLQEAHRRYQRQAPRPLAASFQLVPGFFRNADDSHAAVLRSLLPGVSGVCLVDAPEAPKLLQAYSKSCPDELGLVVLGHECPDPASCQGDCGVPATTSTGEQVILHACWHNLGQRDLHIQCEHDVTMAPPEAVCICFTVFRDEHPAAEWLSLTRNPVRAILDKLRNSGADVSLEAPWGRSFRLASKTATPADCDSVQFHGRLPRSELLPVLRKSGHNLVYATPKSWRHEVMSGFSVLWTTGGRDEAIAQSLQLKDQLGIVRSRQRYGIRLEESSFQAAWSQLKPGIDAPPKVVVNSLYKLLSVPPDVRAQDLQTWAAHLKWKVRPLRSLGPREWLVGADGPPPPGLYSINRQAILIQKVEGRQDARPIVRAGRLPRTRETSAELSGDVDPLQANDPWKQYLKTTGSAVPAAAPAALPAPRAPPAPTQHKFDQQDERLQKLEAGLAEVQRGHQAMAQQVASTQAQVEGQVKQVRAELGSFAQDFANQLQVNAEAQQQAQAQQQLQLQLGLQEIKNLLLAPTNRGNPGPGATKRPADQNGEGLPPMVIVVYGTPRCLPDAAQHNNRLLAWAFQRAKISCGPALVGGDFNTLPQDLPAWESFAQQGWVELGEFAAAAYNLELPCTCKGATRFDTFLLPPSLFQFFHSADVLQDAHLFDSHAPMRLRLSIPGATVPRWIWPSPKDFATLLTSTADLGHHYNQQSEATASVFEPAVPESKPGDKIRLWSATVEAAVHANIKEQHAKAPQVQTHKGLPRAYRGRCREVERKQACPPRLPRAGRAGDPEPYDEDTTIVGRQRLRQLRRLVTFRQGLAKFLAGNYNARAPRNQAGTPLSLYQEWRAIASATGYGRSFPLWLLQWPCFTFWPQGLPEMAYLDDLVSFVRFDVAAVNRQNAKVKADLFRFKLQVDETDYSCAKAFACVRPPSKPPFQCVQLVSDQDAVTVQLHNHQLRTFRVRDASKFDVLCHVSFMSVPGQVTAKAADEITVLFPHDDDAVLPLHGSLNRSRQDCSWQGIIGALMDYWHPIWHRDSHAEQADISEWPQFQALLHRLESPCAAFQVDMQDPNAWLHVLRRLSPHKAKGICGWSNADLRVLPAAAVKDLAKIMHCPGKACLPDDLLRSRVAVLSKVDVPTCASQVIKVWSQQLPPGVAGLSLDLRKAFNFLPRVQRHFEVHSSLGPGLPATTGAPEGDPVSVLAMLGICFMFVALLQNLVQARTYMDNWTWSADQPDCHGPALLILQDLTSALKLEIDWKKTYVWGTETISQRWWRQIGPAFLPPEVSLPVVTHVRELGAFLQFSRRPHRKGFADRVEDAVERMAKLAKGPQSHRAKARVLQSGIWPFLFFGSEGLCPGATMVQNLRGHAARAVVGHHHTMSPFAALYLAPHVQDPEVYLMCHHLRQLRRCADLFPEIARTIWHRLVFNSVSQRGICGPAGALHVLLTRNGWVPKADGWCKGPLNCIFHMFRSNIRTITRMVQLAWADTVQDQVQHRVGLRNAPVPLAAVNHQVLGKFRPWEQKILLRHFAGGYMSGTEKQTWSRTDCASCPLCGQEDTKAHRIFHCPALAAARNEHCEVLQQVQQQCPYWTHMTYASLPDQCALLHLLLQPLKLPALAPAPADDQTLYLFTDGSAQHSKLPLARVATWAVILAAPHLQGPIARREAGARELGFRVLAQGCVPGEQTVPRAELCALIWATRWADQSGCTANVYSDCQPAIDAWELWHKEGLSAVQQKTFSDLFGDWTPPGPCSVHKVKAHQTEADWQVADQYQRWLAAGNDAADAAAKQAYEDLPEVLRDTADQVAGHCATQAAFLQSFCRALLDVGVLDIKLRDSVRRHQSQTAASASDNIDAYMQCFGSWRISNGICQLPEHIEANWHGWQFGEAFGNGLLDWIGLLEWPCQPVPPHQAAQVSYLELAFHFTWTTGMAPPMPSPAGNGQGYCTLSYALEQLQPCPIKTLVTVFAAALKQLGRRYNFCVLPGVEEKNIPHLQWFGIPAPSPGVSLRPTLPGDWHKDFRWMCEGDVANRLASFCAA
ncbi:unnamed protein product [Symbiodinium sp. CCMP2592]|nr:unnamed protein product [Symbiodinium sp. CCMP2592]